MLWLVLALASSVPAAAEILPSDPGPVTTLHVALGKSAPLLVTGTVERIVLAQPEIASVDQAGPDSLYVIGREIGATNLLVYGPDARLLQVVNIEVGYDDVQLQDDLAATLPGQAIKVSNLSGGLLLRGSVSTPQAAALANALAAQAAGGDVISILDVRPDQVLLEVQVIEISQDGLRDIGLDLSAIGSGAALQSGSGLIGADAPQSRVGARGRVAGLDLTAVLGGLEQRGAARVLARPQLLALSGEMASFRAGGEFPFPVPTRDGLTIEFKPYGTAIAVRPTVLDNGLIHLELTAEVSSLDPRNSLRIGNLTVPALSTRRAASTLELRDGERFMLAGLLSETDQQQTSQTPWAADLPLVGQLFKAVRTRHQQLQLAIIVTAHVVGGPDAAAATLDQAPAQAIPPEKAVADPIKPRRPGLLTRVTSLPLVKTISRHLTLIANRTFESARHTLEGLARRVAGRNSRLTG